MLTRLDCIYEHNGGCLLRSRNSFETRTSEGPFKNWRVIVKYRVEARIPSLYFDDCFIPYVKISNTAAGPRNKS